MAAGIPYKIVGGVNFYARKEIKDLLSYLKTVDNGRDDLAVRRIINVPRRGIGATTINRVQDYADRNGMSFYDALCNAQQIPSIGKAAAKIQMFTGFIQGLRARADYLSVEAMLEEIIEDTGYVRDLELEETEEANARIENIDELISKAAAFDEETENPSLNGFLEEVALVADIDDLENGSDYVVLMTLHSAKGLEFPNVYMAGMEDGLFPSYMTITSDDPMEIEEERRLCYVGITRAKERLTLTGARMRMVRGETRYSKVSRFVKEIPEALLRGEMPKEKITEMPDRSSYQSAKKSFQSRPFGSVYQDRFSKSAYGNGGRATTGARSFDSGATAGKTLDYKEGDRVKHMKFGEGTVQKILAGGRDFEVTVDFDKVGVKKMFASFAKLKKV